MYCTHRTRSTAVLQHYTVHCSTVHCIVGQYWCLQLCTVVQQRNQFCPPLATVRSVHTGSAAEQSRAVKLSRRFVRNEETKLCSTGAVFQLLGSSAGHVLCTLYWLLAMPADRGFVGFSGAVFNFKCSCSSCSTYVMATICAGALQFSATCISTDWREMASAAQGMSIQFNSSLQY